MPITAPTLRAAAEQFRKHINRVLALTVTETRLVLIPSPTLPRVQLAFRQGGRPIEAKLHTRFGMVGLHLAQTCEAEPIRERKRQPQRLRTVAYRYTLTPAAADDPLLRWEYDKQLSPQCRHHLQGTVELMIGRQAVRLNDLHLPTGFTTIEEVLRFCIVDLGT